MISLRPHHILCIQSFIGNGYSPAFTRNMTQIIKRLTGGEAFQLTDGADAICAACPHNVSGHCESGQKVASYDAAVTHALRLDIIPLPDWAGLQSAVRKTILAPGLLPQICTDCCWLELCLSVNRKDNE